MFRSADGVRMGLYLLLEGISLGDNPQAQSLIARWRVTSDKQAIRAVDYKEK